MRRLSFWSVPLLALTAACSPPAAPPAATAPAAATPALGIRPYGDETIKPDTSRLPADVAKVFDHIDQNIDQHVVNLQKWIQ